MDNSLTLSALIISLITLTFLEVVLAVDNLVFISITSSRLPLHQQKSARRVGLLLAWVTRLILLAAAVWIAKLTKPLFIVFGFSVSARDIFLFLGGLFLLMKATHEIHLEMESVANNEENSPPRHSKFFSVVTQIAIFDIIFSFDSVLTAIGLVQQFWIMATAITIAVAVMIFASEPLSRFVMRHPTVKMLALSFLILIGMVLVADGLHFEVPRGYIYFSVCFSLAVESLNLYRQKRKVKRKSRQQES